jgi:hypothetical protein
VALQKLRRLMPVITFIVNSLADGRIAADQGTRRDCTMVSVDTFVSPSLRIVVDT